MSQCNGITPGEPEEDLEAVNHEYYEKSMKIYEMKAPDSLDAAATLNNIGMILLFFFYEFLEQQNLLS